MQFHFIALQNVQIDMFQCSFQREQNYFSIIGHIDYGIACEIDFCALSPRSQSLITYYFRFSHLSDNFTLESYPKLHK